MSEEFKTFADTLKDEIKKDVTNIVRWYLGFSFGIIVLLAGFIGWTAKSSIQNKLDHEALKNDFGTVLMITQPAHSDALMFNEMVKKYNPTRGQK
jgi:hypothetical protein